MTGTDTDWMRDAACMGRTDLDWFDLECGHHEAVKVCHHCPVITDCLNYATTNEIEDGIWGGLWGGNLLNMTLAKGKGVQGG